MITKNLEFVNEKIDNFTLHKSYALDFQQKLAKLYEGDIQYTDKPSKKAENVLNCGTFLAFIKYNDPNNTSRLYGANFCKHKLCPMCAWRAHLKNSVKFEKAFRSMPEHDYYHLVLTIQNVPHITKEFIINLRQKATQFIKKSMKVKDFFLSFELTIGKDGNYHPHYHIIYYKDGTTYTKKWMQTEWAKVCNYGKQYQIVNNRKCNKNTISRELTKYILKFEDINPNEQQLRVIDVALKGIRKYSANGSFKIAQYNAECEIDKEEFDKLFELDHYSAEISFYKWFIDNYQITEKSTIEAKQ